MRDIQEYLVNESNGPLTDEQFQELIQCYEGESIRQVILDIINYFDPNAVKRFYYAVDPKSKMLQKEKNNRKK